MKYLYELIGTFFLVLTVGMTVFGPNNLGNFAPLAIGSILAVMVYAGGHISGGHYNPAVSLAVHMQGKLSRKDLGMYWVYQLVGAIIAAVVTLYLQGTASVMPKTIDVARSFIAEFLFTFALCYVVLNVAVAKQNASNSFFGFAIGFTVLVGAYAVGSISGGAFNPAVALGLSILNLTSWSNLWVYLVATLLGAAASSWVFKKAHSGV